MDWLTSVNSCGGDGGHRVLLWELWERRANTHTHKHTAAAVYDVLYASLSLTQSLIRSNPTTAFWWLLVVRKCLCICACTYNANNIEIVWNVSSKIFEFFVVFSHRNLLYNIYSGIKTQCSLVSCRLSVCLKEQRKWIKWKSAARQRRNLECTGQWRQVHIKILFWLASTQQTNIWICNAHTRILTYLHRSRPRCDWKIERLLR